MKSIHPKKTNYLNNTTHQRQRVKSIWNLLKEMCESTTPKLQLFTLIPSACLAKIWTSVNIYEWFATPITKLFWVNKPKGNEKFILLFCASDTDKFTPHSPCKPCFESLRYWQNGNEFHSPLQNMVPVLCDGCWGNGHTRKNQGNAQNSNINIISITKLFIYLFCNYVVKLHSSLQKNIASLLCGMINTTNVRKI